MLKHVPLCDLLHTYVHIEKYFFLLKYFDNTTHFKQPTYQDYAKFQYKVILAHVTYFKRKMQVFNLMGKYSTNLAAQTIHLLYPWKGNKISIKRYLVIKKNYKQQSKSC